MAELGDVQWEGSSVASAACPQLAGNRLNLDVYPDGCQRFLQLMAQDPEEMRQVQFLRLSSNDELIHTAVASATRLSGLTSVTLKGGHMLDKVGACQRGLLLDLPQDFGGLLCLAHLDLSFNCFSSLPECITDLINLRVLILSHNQLLELPENLGRLKKLTVLSAMNNQIKDLPKSIGELEALQVLTLSENLLQFVPDEIGNLQSCTELDFSGNQLKGIPNSIATLRIYRVLNFLLTASLLSLRELHLHSNQLVAVPSKLATLPHLCRLGLQNNCLRCVPIEIQECAFVHLRGNPLGQPVTPKPEQIGLLQGFIWC